MHKEVQFAPNVLEKYESSKERRNFISATYSNTTAAEALGRLLKQHKLISAKISSQTNAVFIMLK